MGERHAAGQFQQFQVAPLGQDRLGNRPGEPGPRVFLGHQLQIEGSGPQIGDQLDSFACEQFAPGFAQQLPGPVFVGSQE